MTKNEFTTAWVAFLQTNPPGLTPDQLRVVARYTPTISAQVDWWYAQIAGAVAVAKSDPTDVIAVWKTVMDSLPATDFVLTPDEIRALIPTTPNSVSLDDFMTVAFKEIGKYYVIAYNAKLIAKLNEKIAELGG